MERCPGLLILTKKKTTKEGKYKSDSACCYRSSCETQWGKRVVAPAPAARGVLRLHPSTLHHPPPDASSPERWGYGASSGDPPKAMEWRKMPWTRQCNPSGVGLPEVWESPKVAVSALWASALCPHGLQGASGGDAGCRGLGAMSWF